MQKRKLHLQRHRMAAFSKTLVQVHTALERRITFLNDYSNVYRLPKGIMKRNMRKYNRLFKAAKTLMELEKPDIS